MYSLYNFQCSTGKTTSQLSGTYIVDAFIIIISLYVSCTKRRAQLPVIGDNQGHREKSLNSLKKL